MTRTMRTCSTIMLCILAVIGGGLISRQSTQAQPDTRGYAEKFFLDAPPSNSELARLPTNATNVIVAKVCILGSVFSRVGRDQSGMPPPQPKYIFGAEVKLLDVLQGNAKRDSRYVVSFAAPNLAAHFTFPHTPEMRARNYFIVSYEDSGERLLVGYPENSEEFASWQAEMLNFEKLRGQPDSQIPNNKGTENCRTTVSDKNCIPRLALLISELDTLLSSNPPRVGSISSLLYKHLPLENCDVQEAIKTVKGARFLSHIAGEKTYVSFVFDTKGFAGPSDPGFHVQLSFDKASGNSQLPFVMVNKPQ